MKVHEYYTTVDGKEVIDSKWVDAEAMKAVNSFSRKMEYNQIRKFYSEIKNLERQLFCLKKDETSNSIAEILPMLKLLKAKSAYAVHRSVVPEEFKTWIWGHVDSIKNSQDFKVFALHFEAVVGFSYVGKRSAGR